VTKLTKYQMLRSKWRVVVSNPFIIYLHNLFKQCAMVIKELTKILYEKKNTNSQKSQKYLHVNIFPFSDKNDTISKKVYHSKSINSYQSCINYQNSNNSNIPNMFLLQ